MKLRLPVLMLRALVIGGVGLAILVPIALVDGKISERRERAEAVERQFAQETSGPQTLVGPLLALTCEETYTEERQVMRAGKAETVAEKKVTACPTGFFPPQSLKVAGKLPVESRYRGIYPIRLYRAALDVSADFTWPAPPPPGGSNARAWKSAYILVGVTDSRGLKSVVKTSTAGTAGAFDGRYAIQDDYGDYSSRKPGDAVAVGYKMELMGTSSLNIVPVGDTTVIRLASSWPHPSFIGAYRPDEREIGPDGFVATWRTSHFATGGRAAWEQQARDGSILRTGTTSGVSLFDPVNVYALSFRATQYGFLFVLFTFAALALAEVVSGVRLHSVQYLLVGSALAVFFLLLLALSEHIAFSRAYATAAAACIALLTFYLRHPLGSLKRTAAFLGFFVTLYATLFVLLRSEDHAMLMGSLMVFGVLAIAMVATRKTDWRSLRAPSDAPTG